MKEVDQQTRYVVCDTMGSITNSVLDALVACIPIVTSEWVRSFAPDYIYNGLQQIFPYGYHHTCNFSFFRLIGLLKWEAG